MQTIFGRDYPKVVIPLIQNAKRSIDILVYEWRWYPDQIGTEIQKFNTALIYAARRGVNVRAITRTKNTVKILQENNVDAKEWSGGNIMHTKMILIDNEFLVLGSHNFTQNAFTLNMEASSLQQVKSGWPDVLKYFNDIWLL